MFSDTCGKKINKYVPDYVLFDLETTGISWKTDDVIEISAVKVIEGNIVDEFSTLVNPGRRIPYQATLVNGITDDMVADSPSFREGLPKFMEFAGDFVLAGHNIFNFDMKFLDRDARRYFGETIGNDYVDTLHIARACLPQLQHHKLTDLATHYGISTEGAHRALNDCRMNQMVFEFMGKDMCGKELPEENIRKCPKCGEPLKVRKGIFGEFLGCSGYPACRYTEKIRK